MGESGVMGEGIPLSAVRVMWAVEVEIIEMHVDRGPAPANRGAVAVSATLFRARGTHAVLPASRPDSDAPFGVSAPDGLTSRWHAKRCI